jgi:anti-sigma factor RsiW
MECDRLAMQLDIAPSADTQDPYFADIVEHLRECGICRGKMEKRLKAESQIKAEMESMSAIPDTLLASVIGATGRIETGRRRWRSFVAVAASFVLAVGFSASGYNYWKHGVAEAAVKKLCILSIRNHEASHVLEFASDNPEAISQWLSGRLGHFVKMPGRLNIGSITGARRCALGEHAVAAINFAVDGKRGTLFSFYPDQFGVAGIAEPPKVEMGYTVAVWEENGMGYSLVSEAPVEKIKAMFANGLLTGS